MSLATTLPHLEHCNRRSPGNLRRAFITLLLTAALGSCMSFQDNMLRAHQAADSLNSSQRDTADELFKAGEYQQAIAAYGRITGSKERVLQLRRRLEVEQRGTHVGVDL